MRGFYVLDVKDLERRWLKYKVKSFFPYGAAVLLLAGGIMSLSLWLAPQPEDHALEKKERSVKANRSASPATLPAQEATTLLEPSMDFVHTFQENTADTTSEPAPLPKVPSAAYRPPIPPPAPKMLAMPEAVPAQTFQEAPLAAAKSDRTLSINRNEAKLDIDELQYRFKETSNANLGLFIARYYYDRGNYSEAYNYALKTNAINSKIDESWILFSKSLVKLGRTEQAKKTLQLYVQQSNSEGAKALLESIEKGAFK